MNNIEKALLTLRKEKPLVLNLTNYVTMDFMANGLLALGAAPLMSSSEEELEELVQIAGAVMINIGTLSKDFNALCYKALELAKYYKKPIILDPVGAGATILRTKTAREFLQHATIVRGNASEIMALGNDNSKSLGVESLDSTESAQAEACELARTYNVTITVSGALDFITDGTRKKLLQEGHSLMTRVTGMGCLLTAVIAAFRTVVPDSFEAATIATAYFGLCGGLAATKATQPGTFRVAFIDALYAADFQAMKQLHL